MKMNRVMGLGLVLAACVGCSSLAEHRKRAEEAAYRSRTASRIMRLDLAVWEYKQNMELGGNFPGLEQAEDWEGDYTGSQVLAAHLFDYYAPASDAPYGRIDAAEPGARSTYADFRPGMLGHMGSEPGQMNFLMDAYPDPMPILYYPSGRPTELGYSFEDNAAITGKTAEEFEAFILDPDVTGNFRQPVSRNGFLLIAPGPDREYFTDDDIRNW
jgi:hypothetical protein